MCKKLQELIERWDSGLESGGSAGRQVPTLAAPGESATAAFAICEADGDVTRASDGGTCASAAVAVARKGQLLATPVTVGRLGVMSAHGGMPARHAGMFMVAAVLAMSLAGCEYSGPDERPAPSSAPATPQPRSFEENAGEVARLLEASPGDPGMPSEAEPAGKLSLDLAPGDYLVTGACAGVYGAKLTVVKADGVPEAASFECDAPLDRFVRHGGGPLTISAVPPTGRPAATGVKVQTNLDPRASELEDISEWAAQQLQPRLPGELRGTSSGNTTSIASLSAPPGQYELHFVCAGLPSADLSVATWRGVEVLAPVHVPCSGSVFTAPVVLPTEGADLTMGPGGLDSRFAYRLVPAGQP